MSMVIDEIRAYVLTRLGTGGNPNDVLRELSDAAEGAVVQWAEENGWGLWGDGEWREDSACSICGSELPGICGHQDDPNQIVLRGRAANDRYQQKPPPPEPKNA